MKKNNTKHKYYNCYYIGNFLNWLFIGFIVGGIINIVLFKRKKQILL